MGHLGLWLLALAAGQTQAASILQCCKEKSVGGVEYTLVDETDTAKYGCKSNCVFEKMGSPGSRFCFKEGDLEVVCGDDNVAEGADVLALVKSYIDSDTCNQVTYATYNTSVCRDNAKSFYKEFLYKGKRVIVSNNIPDHPAEHDALLLSQVGSSILYRCPGWQFVQLPVDPEKAATGITDAGKGAIGYAVTGGVFFSQLAGKGTELALTNEGGSLDSCMGHSAPTGKPGGMGPPPSRQGEAESASSGELTAGAYHYHANLNCSNAGAASGAGDPAQCKLIGYYRDGVPVYGFCRDNTGRMMTSCYKIDPTAALVSVTSVTGVYVGALNSEAYSYQPDEGCNLDEASGAIHPTSGKYSYFMTSSYPWVPPKFAGSMGTANACGAA